MTYEQKNLEGSLFRNDKGDNPKRPDFKGSITINGVKYWLSGWSNPPKDGKKGYMSLKAEEAGDKKTGESQEWAETTSKDLDDSIPF